jgi:hypothetical protein
VAVLAWQDKKRVAMVSTYHKDDMHVVVVDLKDQMLQPYLLE